jgi:MT0933-like antitoxin protein
MPDFRKLAAKARGLLGEHKDQADEGIKKAGESADQHTGGHYSDHIQQGEQRAQDYLGGGGETGGQPGQDQGGSGNQ